MITKYPPQLIVNDNFVYYQSCKNSYPTLEFGMLGALVDETKIYNLNLFEVQWNETEEIYSDEVITRHLTDVLDDGTINSSIHSFCIGLRFVKTSSYLSDYYRLQKMLKDKEYTSYLKGVMNSDDIFDLYYEYTQNRYNIYFVLMNKGVYGYTRPIVKYGRGGRAFLVAESKPNE